MMNSSKCLVHMVNKIQLSCLKNQCRHKLQCWRCHYQENKHHSQLIEQAMLFNRIEDKQIFIQIVNECIQQCDNSQQFKQMLKQKVMEEMIDKKQNLKIMSKVMADKSQQTMNQWINDMNDRMDKQQYQNVNDIKNSMMDDIKIQSECQHGQKESDLSELVKQNKQLEEKIKELQEEIKDQLKDRRNQVDMLIGNNKDLEGFIRKIKQQHQEQLDAKDSEINELIKQNQDFKTKIKEQYQEIKKQLKNIKKDVRGINGEGQDIKGLIKRQQYELKQEVEKKQQQLSGLIKQGDTNKISVIQQLQQCQNVVWIGYYDDLDKCKKQIEEYEQNSKQYQIQIIFGYPDNGFNSIDNKMRVLEMINRLNVNNNVGEVVIGLHSNIKWNDEILRIIMNRYSSMYCISIWDRNHQTDDRIHKIIKQWVLQQPIIEFQLCFYGCLASNDDGLKLMKEYNQLIKLKQYLEWLRYDHNRLSGENNAQSKQTIKELIIKVDKL